MGWSAEVMRGGVEGAPVQRRLARRSHARDAQRHGHVYGAAAGWKSRPANR